jgi:hypothetical protein
MEFRLYFLLSFTLLSNQEQLEHIWQQLDAQAAFNWGTCFEVVLALTCNIGSLGFLYSQSLLDQ